IYCNCGTFTLGTTSVTAARGNNPSVEEEDQGVYLQADWKAEWGIPMRGNIGVRYVETDMSYQGYSTTGAPVTAGNDYSDLLPSLHVVFDPTPDLLLRVGPAKAMTRPALVSVSPGIGSLSLLRNLAVHNR